MNNLSFSVIEAEKLQELIDKVDKLYKILQAERIQPNKLYTNHAACVYLQVCSKTLQNYRDDGLIKFSQVGRKIFYTQVDLNYFLEKYKKEIFITQIKTQHAKTDQENKLFYN